MTQYNKNSLQIHYGLDNIIDNHSINVETRTTILKSDIEVIKYILSQEIEGVDIEFFNYAPEQGSLKDIFYHVTKITKQGLKLTSTGYLSTISHIENHHNAYKLILWASSILLGYSTISSIPPEYQENVIQLVNYYKDDKTFLKNRNKKYETAHNDKNITSIKHGAMNSKGNFEYTEDIKRELFPDYITDIEDEELSDEFPGLLEITVPVYKQSSNGKIKWYGIYKGEDIIINNIPILEV